MLCAAYILDGAAGHACAGVLHGERRVLVASLPQHEIDGWIANQELLPLTPHTIVHPERLRIEIARVRQQGWASVDQEFELGLRTVGVPLKNYRGETVATLNISVHAARMTMDQLVEANLPPLLQSQAQLRQLLK